MNCKRLHTQSSPVPPLNRDPTGQKLFRCPGTVWVVSRTPYIEQLLELDICPASSLFASDFFPGQGGQSRPAPYREEPFGVPVRDSRGGTVLYIKTGIPTYKRWFVFLKSF